MRESRAICLACRARLSAQHAAVAVLRDGRSHARGPWHATAATAATATLPARTAASASMAGSASRQQQQTASLTTAVPARKKRPRQELDDEALALFRDVVEKQGREQQDDNDDRRPQTVQPSGRPLSVGTELYQQFMKLAQLRSQPNVSVAELYAFFETNMYPQMAQTARRDLPHIFKQAAQKLVSDVSAAKKMDYTADGLPSVARITQIRRQLDLLNMPEAWVPLVFGLLEDILETSESGGSDGDGDEQAKAHREAQIDDLVQTWRFFSLPDMVVADPEALSRLPASEFRLPTPDAAHLARRARQQRLPLVLAMLFPRYAPRQLEPVVPALVASYALLTDLEMGTPEAQEQAREFLQAVGDVLSAVPITRQAVADLFRAWPTLGAYVLRRWPLVAHDTEGAGVGAAAAAAAAAATGARRRPSSSLDSIHNQLGRALRARNPEACEAAWDVFWSSVTVPDADGAERLHESAEMFDYFIMAFTTMRQPERAISIWNLMTMAGVQPTLRTWTSFMEGCKRASNPTGIRNIWDKLMASGLPVDTAVWTARISGLIQAGEARAGIEALDEMQQVWEAAQRGGNPDKAVKPTIEPVNAAIAGVLRGGDLGAARQILAWAGRHEIAPDLITFNTILRPLVREGRADEVAGVLEMMRKSNIEPDEATVTVLLEGVFGGADGQRRRNKSGLEESTVTAAEQAETVRRVLAEVEAAGLQANQQTYAKIVHLVLQQAGGSNGDAAVEVVLARMDARGLPLSSHLCAIFVEHYFSRDPPDIEAVRALIETGRPRRLSGDLLSSPSSSQEHSPVQPPWFDRVFWERVVSGFARIDDTANALRYFAHISDSVSVTTSTLEDLLRSLIRNNEWEAAAELVARAQAQKTQLMHSDDPSPAYDRRYFRHRFWHLAAEHGLLS